MYSIELKNMEFFAHHGCFEEEQIIGNNFVVNLTVHGDFSKAAKSDDIEDALNYQELYDIVKEQMAIKSHLLENVAKRIGDKLIKRFPQISKYSLRIDKINPPLGGKLYSSSVTLDYPDEQ
ncbi:MAG: dihydroneopterin aldolase [Candidatus Egerieousia sp.]